jgi:TonB family protein
VLAAALLVAGCAAPPKPLPPPPPSAPVKFDAFLLPGCLMPEPGEQGVSTSGSAALQLHVTKAGEVSSAAVARSSGSATLDSALQAAARACRFSPAYSVDSATFKRTEIEDTYTLNTAWPGPVLVGPHRCFAPDYTHAARRSDEEGTVIVEFRLNRDTGALDARVRPNSAPGRHIRDLSLRAVQACVMAHPEARKSLTPGDWYAIPYAWRLE